jgi:cation transport ATPase
MISGDNQQTAYAVGQEVGIPQGHIMAGVLPEEKAKKVQYLQRSLVTECSSFYGFRRRRHRKATVAMVGDGINDSPALTVADVGIAIGSGSDVAISSAKFVLISSNLNSLITLIDLSRLVFRRVKFNFGWALVYNVVALPIAAGVLYPVRTRGGDHIRLDPVWASLAMALSSLSVVGSSLSLRTEIPGMGFRRKSWQ